MICCETAMISLDQARAAKLSAAKQLAALNTVVGIGITRIADDYAVKVNLSEAPPPDFTLPSVIDGVPIRFEIVGTIRPREP